MPILLGFFPSPRKDKRYRMIFANPHRIVDFGMKQSNTYVDGATDIKRTNYLKRHGKEDCTQISPASASAFILWGNGRDIGDNLIQYLDEFKTLVPSGSKIIFES